MKTCEKHEATAPPPNETNSELNELSLALTLDSIGDGVISTDRDGRITRINRVAQALTGWSLSEARNHYLHEVFNIVDGDSGERLPNPFDAALLAGFAVNLPPNTALVARDGKRHLISDSAAPIQSSRHTAPSGIVLVFRDITEKTKLDLEYQQAKNMEMIGRLAGGVAHDFNNLLTGIIGYSELLIHGLDEHPVMQESARAVVATAERAAKLTRQLLAVSRKDKIVSHRVDFHACIESVVDLMQTTIDRRISIASSLLATETDVFGDSSSLSAAMLNLGINARDAITGKGKITFETKNVRLDQDFISGKGFNVEPGQYIEMKISDTGAGMTQDVKEHLYEPFYTTKELGQGTGLGLAAVYGTMMAHQGAISCESKLGHGTEFRLYLPLGKAPAVLAEEALDWEEEGSGRILVVDDERIIRETATATLEAIGYQVIVAHDGAEAIEIYRREGTRIDLVILDVVMPGITGPDTFYTLRSICPTVKVLFSSGYSFDADGQRLVNESKFGFIQKPYRRNELYAAVQKELPPSRPAEFASKLTGN